MVGVDQNPMLEIPWHLEISTIEMRKNQPRLIRGLQHEWDGDAEAHFDPFTESRYRIRLDQNAIAASRRHHHTRLPSIKRFAAGHEVTAAGKLGLGFHAPKRLSHPSDDCTGRQLYLGANFLIRIRIVVEVEGPV